MNSLINKWIEVQGYKHNGRMHRIWDGVYVIDDMYLKKDELDVQLLGRGFAWLDTGTMDSLVDAADFVRMIEKRQGIKISAPEEIAYKYGWIDRDTLLESAARYGKSPYGQHLKNVADGKLRY